MEVSPVTWSPAVPPKTRSQVCACISSSIAQHALGLPGSGSGQNEGFAGPVRYFCLAVGLWGLLCELHQRMAFSCQNVCIHVVSWSSKPEPGYA